MNEEYVWKEMTGKLAVLDTKPNYNITLHNGCKQVGTMDFNGPKMVFEGDAAESAKVFFDFIAKTFKARLEHERADEREACAKMIESHGPHMPYVAMHAAAIRARSNT